MSLLNVAPENHDYDGLNENSTDIEKLNVVFKVLQKTSSPIWLEYDKLFVTRENQKIFDAKLQKSGLVSFEMSKMDPTYQLNDDGILFLDKYGSYSNYISQLQEQQEIQRTKLEVRENLEMQKLRGEVDDLTNRLLDYDSTRNDQLEANG